MPLLEKLDNKRNPTGIKKFHSEKEWNYLRRLKYCCWRLVESEKPMISRAQPVTVIGIDNDLKDFPTETYQQHEWIDRQTDIATLEKATLVAKKMGVKTHINQRLEELRNQSKTK